MNCTLRAKPFWACQKAIHPLSHLQHAPKGPLSAFCLVLSFRVTRVMAGAQMKVAQWNVSCGADCSCC